MSERPVAEIDLNGIEFSQNCLDWLYKEINLQVAQHKDEPAIDIVIKRLSTQRGMPRLIVDDRNIYEALVKLLNQSTKENL